MSCFIKLENVDLHFPIYGSNASSFKKTLAASVTGGRIGKGTGVTTVQALSNINLHLTAGDRLGIVGHNGAGKSTLLRLLAGAYFPSGGKYERQGSLTSLIDPNMGIEADATGIENIILRCIVMGLKKKKMDEIIDEIIDFSGLGEYIYMPVRTYSTGMMMRLSFSIATSVRSDILLMDEWLSVGDVDFQHKAEMRMRALLEKTGILVLASHSSELIKRECNKSILMEHGKIISIEC